MKFSVEKTQDATCSKHCHRSIWMKCLAQAALLCLASGRQMPLCRSSPPWFLRRPSTSLNRTALPIHIDQDRLLCDKKSFIMRAAALCRVCEFHSVCDVFPDVFSLSFSKVWWWWLTIFEWLWSDFFKPYFCIFTLRSLFWSSMLLNVWRSSVTIEFIFIQIYIFFVSFPLFFNFPCANVQKSVSTQYYSWCNVDSCLFFYIHVWTENLYKCFQSLCVKFMYKLN